MNKKEYIFALFLWIFCYLYLDGCSSENLVRPEECINNKPVEDTNRVWKLTQTGSSYPIYIVPDVFFAQFYSSVKDTNKIKQMLSKYKLKTVGTGFLYGRDSVISAGLISTEGKRSEYHFTPYGKSNYCNFGTDSMVEYSFGIFDNGKIFFDGQILFVFVKGTTDERIDSLFNANGLRLCSKSIDPYNGEKYYAAMITPKAKKNVLDLSDVLTFVTFIKIVTPNSASGEYPEFKKKLDLIIKTFNNLF